MKIALSYKNVNRAFDSFFQLSPCDGDLMILRNFPFIRMKNSKVFVALAYFLCQFANELWNMNKAMAPPLHHHFSNSVLNSFLKAEILDSQAEFVFWIFFLVINVLFSINIKLYSSFFRWVYFFQIPLDSSKKEFKKRFF